jgi:hypothetical protein
MPEISRFYGIVIKMYHNDHSPPHLHAEYGGAEIVAGWLTASRPVKSPLPKSPGTPAFRTPL